MPNKTKTRTIKVQLPESHQELLEDLALAFDMNLSDMTIACLELVGEVYTSNTPHSKRPQQMDELLTKLRHNHDELIKAVNR